MTVYSLDVFLSWFGTSLLFHVQFQPLLLDLHTDFSGDRSGGLVVPSLLEFPQLKPGLESFEHYFINAWDEWNCAVVWAFFGIAFLWGWNENRPFPVLWPLLSFPDLLAYWVQHTFTASSFRIWNSSTGILSPLPALLMFLKIHLTSPSRMSGCRWAITPSWLSESCKSFCIVLLCILANSS